MREKTFPPVTRAQWEARASKDLKGRALASLTRTSADGLELPPLHLRDDGAPAPRQLPGRGWLRVQDYHHADVRAANAAARRDLELGADGLRFVIDSELRAGREPGAVPDGLVCDPSRELDTLLEGIDPTRTPVFIDAGLLAPAWADALELWIDEHSSSDGPETVELGRGPSHGGVIYDPIATLVQTGSLERGFEGALGQLTDTILGMTPGVLGVSTSPYHDAGASDAHELALALSTCAELLRRGVGLGLEIADLAGTMLWTLPIGGRPFEAIAKLRAARLLWAKFTRAAGHPGEAAPGLWIHATPSPRSWTRYGPWVNLLRGTVASFAAALGGANSVASAAFDGLRGPEGDAVEGLGRGSELGRRLALNTQLILREESQLASVIDPAGGSWYVESLTDALARAAWERFRELEASGGLVASLVSGSIQREIAAAAARLRQAAATRELPLTGVSTFPVLDEQPTPAQAPNSFTGDGPEPQRTGPVLEPAEVPKLTRLRLAAPFERLRDAAEAWAQEQGARPKIYSCKLGSIAAHQARAEFAANCFRAGGLEVVASGAATREAAAAGLRDSGCALAVICARDQDLPEGLVEALREAGAKQVWIAAPPREWPSKPPPRFVFRGCDLLGELSHAMAELGVITPDQEQA
ncbi:Methylmalonyl-CoA mutase small subunit [Enhygromyxa salina]|uniref:Methylmalonyl-CoA mutase small subunit n=1 Tax=Enhygromyxa salina TaxID=215803 RepID=A0A2S9YBV6_9BACT|nr:methylmalonyl-CoA mutase family protein [Enhygromyxa salina]PRQ02583.1 Methylmalonyl-CoA mutase small subunit [Enhygromyxa salina]